MQNLKLFFILLTLLGALPLSSAAVRCEEIFVGTGNHLQSSIENLAGLKLRLESAKITGEDSIALRVLKQDYEKKKQDLIEFVEHKQIMTAGELIQRMRQEITRIQKEMQSNETKETRNREEQVRQRKNLIVGTQAILYKIEPGAFKMGDQSYATPVEVRITKPFEMMSTLTTQTIWKKVARLINIHLGSKYKINEDPSHFKGDTLPVDSVNYKDVQDWLLGLTELSRMGISELKEIIPSHKTGDVYRLPTNAEWDFVVRARGLYSEKVFWEEDLSRVVDYAWTKSDSDKRTQAVALKEPLKIGKAEFYDMLGNAWEWVQDWYQDPVKGYTEGDDPSGPASGESRILRGGSYFETPGATKLCVLAPADPVSRYDGVSFRFIRESNN